MLIISEKFGQLSNRMILFANFISFSFENNIPVYNPSFDEYSVFFEGTHKGLMIKNRIPVHFFDSSKFSRSLAYRIINFMHKVMRKINVNIPFIKNLTIKNSEKTFVLDDPENLNALTSAGIVLLSGWLFRSETLVAKHAVFIREYFTPLEIHRKNVNTIVSTVRTEFKIIIGIHMRKGDYKTFNDGRFYYTDEQYLTVMKKIMALFDNCAAFILCSNEKIDLNNFPDIPVFKSTGHLIEDQYCLSLCDYIAGPPSTFTMWASFHGQKPLYFIEDTSKSIDLSLFEVSGV